MEGPNFTLEDLELAYKVFDQVVKQHGLTPLSELPDKTKSKSGTQWFFTIAKPEGITQPWFKSKCEKCFKKTHIKRAMACLEHHKSGKLHAHMIVEMEKPFSLAEIKRKFNFEKVMDMPAYKIIQFDKWEKIENYIKKEGFQIYVK